jgi:hypothetical protein
MFWLFGKILCLIYFFKCFLTDFPAFRRLKTDAKYTSFGHNKLLYDDFNKMVQKPIIKSMRITLILNTYRKNMKIEKNRDCRKKRQSLSVKPYWCFKSSETSYPLCSSLNQPSTGKYNVYFNRVITKCAETGFAPPAKGVMVSEVELAEGLRTVSVELITVV